MQIADCRFQIGVVLVVATVARSVAHAETIDRVLAVVAGQVIMLSDVTAARDLGLVSADAGADPVRAVLSKLIDRALELAEADRYAPPEPSADAIEREVAAVRARFPTAETFDAVLARSGIDLAHVRETLRENLRIRAYLDQRFIIAGTPPAAENEARRQTLIDEWLAGLRRRADIIDLYLPER